MDPLAKGEMRLSVICCWTSLLNRVEWLPVWMRGLNVNGFFVETFTVVVGLLVVVVTVNVGAVWMGLLNRMLELNRFPVELETDGEFWLEKNCCCFPENLLLLNPPPSRVEVEMRLAPSISLDSISLKLICGGWVGLGVVVVVVRLVVVVLRVVG